MSKKEKLPEQLLTRDLADILAELEHQATLPPKEDPMQVIKVYIPHDPNKLKVIR